MTPGILQKIEQVINPGLWNNMSFYFQVFDWMGESEVRPTFFSE